VDPAVSRQTDRQTGPALLPPAPQERVRRTTLPERTDRRGHRSFSPRTVRPVPQSSRALAVAGRRVRVALLVEEEGLERGAMTRIAGWLDVSPATIGRDVRALLAAGDPVIAAAVARERRRRANGSAADGH
jgi:hypothetical protein